MKIIHFSYGFGEEKNLLALPGLESPSLVAILTMLLHLIYV